MPVCESQFENQPKNTFFKAPTETPSLRAKVISSITADKSENYETADLKSSNFLKILII